MSYQTYENKIKALKAELIGMDQTSMGYQELFQTIKKLEHEAMENLTPMDQVYLSRHPRRMHSQDYIDHLFDNFFTLRGDRIGDEDPSIKVGVATFYGISVTVIAQMKGSTLEDNLKCNFGMPRPSAYHKVLRAIKQSEKFNRPIITFVDTPGAYPGIDAEAKGQGLVISQCLQAFSQIEVPVISLVIGEGGSGGALALSVGDYLMMLEHSIYSILSPEGFASILWKDASRASEAAALMKLEAQDLYEVGFVNKIIKEPISGIENGFEYVIDQIKTEILNQLKILQPLPKKQLLNQRYHRIRKMVSE